MSDRMSRADRAAADSYGPGTSIKADKSDDDIADAKARDSVQDTTRLKAKSEAGFPSRKDYGTDSDYYSAIAAYRTKKQAAPDLAGQKKALRSMSSK